MTKDEFQSFLHDNFSLSGEALRLVSNILDFIEKEAKDENAQYCLACDLLSGFGLTDAEMRQIAF